MRTPTPFVPLVARVMAGPVVWIVHFTLLYSTMAVACARPDGMARLSDAIGVTPHGLLHAMMAALTLGALAILAWSLHPFAMRAPGAPNAATRFMVWTTLALALLSAVALATNTLVALSFFDCRG